MTSLVLFKCIKHIHCLIQNKNLLLCTDVRRRRSVKDFICLWSVVVRLTFGSKAISFDTIKGKWIRLLHQIKGLTWLTYLLQLVYKKSNSLSWVDSGLVLPVCQQLRTSGWTSGRVFAVAQRLRPLHHFRNAVDRKVNYCFLLVLVEGLNLFQAR